MSGLPARLSRETQRAYVERVLLSEGSISAWDCLYEGRYEDGGRFSITRLAAIIWTLRHEAGWDIDETAPQGGLAVYDVRRVGYGPEAPRTSAPAVPAWAQGWRCTTCGAPPAREPEPLLGGMGRAHCKACDGTMFRRAA